MRDEIDSRLWLEHGSAFTEDLAKLFRQAGEAINRLNEVQFRAPWRREARSCSISPISPETSALR